MRKVILKHFRDENGNLVEDLTWIDPLMAVLKNPYNPQGTNYEEMELIIPIIRKLKKVEIPSNGESFILLEEEEFKEVCTRVKKGPYNLNAEEMFDMVDSIINTEEYIVKD